MPHDSKAAWEHRVEAQFKTFAAKDAQERSTIRRHLRYICFRQELQFMAIAGAPVPYAVRELGFALHVKAWRVFFVRNTPCVVFARLAMRSELGRVARVQSTWYLFAWRFNN